MTVLDDKAHLPEAKWLRDFFRDAMISFRANSREAQIHATLAGAGVAALARCRAEGKSGLVRLFTDKPDLVRDIWIGVHADMRDMPRVRAATDAVVEALRKNATIRNPGSEHQVQDSQDRFKNPMDQAFPHAGLIKPSPGRCYLGSYLAIEKRKSGRSLWHLMY